MFFAAMLASGYAAYAAPSHEDAYDAYIARILESVRYSGDMLSEPRLRLGPNFPSDLVIERCLPREGREVRLAHGSRARFSGYECIFEVWPNSEPSFRTSGFFRHNGIEWEFYGVLQKDRVPSPSEFDPIKDDGNIIPKDGALAYDGDPENPFNDDYDPYASFFEYSNRKEKSAY